jgi:hypothetical protein
VHGLLIAATNWHLQALYHAMWFGAFFIIFGAREAMNSNSRADPYLRIVVITLFITAVGASWYDLGSRYPFTGSSSRTQWKSLPPGDRWLYRAEGAALMPVFCLPIGWAAVWVARRLYPADGR